MPSAAASRGPIASQYPYNYQQGMGHSRPVGELKGAVQAEEPVSEENARTMFRRWAQYMDAENWDDLLPKP